MRTKPQKFGSHLSRLYIPILLVAVIVLSGCIGPDLDTILPKGSSTGTVIPCTDGQISADDQFLILAPKMLFSGGESSVTMAAFSEDQPARRCIQYTLTDENDNEIQLLTGSTGDSGHTVATFAVPDVEEGRYVLKAQPVGSDTEFKTVVDVVKGNPIFIETDKPIYKPGQIIHGRMLIVNNNLVPVEQDLTIEITDAKGIKVFKENMISNEYGVASFDLPLATELNLGTWKVKATSDSTTSVVDIRVEKYVLPKFKAEVTTPKDWFLVSDSITGAVSAEYFFGKVVEGTVDIKASRYVGTWEEYATFNSALDDGSVEFELPPIEYVAGTYGAGGQGSLMLNVTVTDTGNHSETATKLLKISDSPVVLQLIPESSIIKPGMPLQVLVVTKDPDGNPVDADISMQTMFQDENYLETTEDITVDTTNGVALVSLDVPENVTKLFINAITEDDSARADVSLNAAYSPSASFIHVSQTSDGVPEVGEKISFTVYSTNPGTVFYDVVANGRTVYSATSDQRNIDILVTPQMSPQAKLVAYMINPNSEVSADTLPFDVQFTTRVDLGADFDKEEVMPGDDVGLDFDAGSQSMIGFSIVDESVYALSEGRLNLKQVFDELERRFMEPQAEAHPTASWYRQGAYDVIEGAGMTVLASPEITVPQAEINRWEDEVVFEAMPMMAMDEVAMAAPREKAMVKSTDADVGGVGEEPLAKVQRVRQFFPETWIWMPDLLTDDNGRAHLDLTAPDSITTWRMHAVSSGPAGIGISEADLTVFQEFFLDPDLPYAVTRGEEFPVQVQVYNYLDKPQNVRLTLSGADWFKLVGGTDNSKQEVTVEANSVNYVSFTIRPTEIGTKTIEITAQTSTKADAVKKDIIVEAEGTKREIVENGVLKDGTIEIDPGLPVDIVPDSGKVLVSFTPSIVAQTISGVDSLLDMPYGCGEQNMILFAPDVEILRYLKATGQDNPEIRAKAEMFIVTGYQRELTYQHSDGSFSAFGESDPEGSLWLTSFVLNTFSGARDVTTIDEDVLMEAADWIEDLQGSDGSWEPAGFVIHQDMMGGVSGTYALSAYVTLALAEYGHASPVVMTDAQQYLEDNLDSQDDPYALAIGTLVLQKLNSPKADVALNKLLALSKEDENGMYWGYDVVAMPLKEYGGYGYYPPSSKNVETTAYATLALIEAKNPSASSALKWIAAQRNGNGGFSSTQDTVMAFKALMTAAASAGRDIDAKVSVYADGTQIKSIDLDSENYDVIQIVEVPKGTDTVRLELDGEGEVNYQMVKKFNEILSDVVIQKELELDVEYDSTDVAVNDVVTVRARVKYNGMPGIEGSVVSSSGMMIVDIAVPTGFTPVVSSLDALKDDSAITRYEIAGRKVVLYINELTVGQELKFTMDVKALFPVKATIPDSRAYSYYNPEVKAEVKGVDIVVA
ncbi:MAG: MG2 domain-containing protein [Methanosarcinaceae archaeon]|nr:MG2 domain-containing protein [Methanosarcinaceae archaeon]